MIDESASRGAPEAGRAYGVPPPGFRLPDGTTVGAVRLQITDLDRSLEYYQRVVGMQIIGRTADGAALGALGGSRPLIWLHALPRARAVPPGGALGLYHFALLLPDRAALGRFAAHLRTQRLRAGMADHVVSEALYLSDPDGLGIEVYADRPRSTWRFDGRQLVMGTDPLELGSLIAAGGQQSWEGLPDGTVVGHVHLHVGSLHEAEAFYHAGLGLDKIVWSYPGALFLSAGGYHHHLGTNTWVAGPPAAEDQARLLEWELLVPAREAAQAADSLSRAGFGVAPSGSDWVSADPWGTPVRICAAKGS